MPAGGGAEDLNLSIRLPLSKVGSLQSSPFGAARHSGSSRNHSRVRSDKKRTIEASDDSPRSESGQQSIGAAALQSALVRRPRMYAFEEGGKMRPTGIGESSRCARFERKTHLDVGGSELVAGKPGP